MHSDPKLVARIESIAEAMKLQRKAMFGGYCWFRRGHIACGVWHESLIVRLGEEAALAAMDREHTRPMDFTGRPMKAWVTVDPPGFRTGPQLQDWIDQGVAFADTLPAKSKRKPVSRRTTSKR